MGSIVSYLYYKQSVEGSRVSPAAEDTSVQTNHVITEPIPIRHRPTTYESDLQIEPTQAEIDTEKN